MKGPKIGIYAGSGTSHSWLWFVDLFEKAGFWDLVFLDESAVQNTPLKGLDVLVVSGGDTFAVAQSLGEKGSRNIQAFVAQGGVYMGSCAGAYLPMFSSKKPLDRFNFVDVKITNLSKLFPKEELQACSACAAYGCDFVFHPVREAVSLKTTAFPGRETPRVFSAPLYGGPGMRAHDPAWVLAVYHEFTPKTRFFAPRKVAEKTLLGNGAIVRVPFQKGCFYLLGPHLEHPGFGRANQFIIEALVRETGGGQPETGSENRPPDFFLKEKIEGKAARELLLAIRRELSNSRIVTTSLEFMPVQWLIGQKTYDPLKIRVFLESMWKRLRLLEKPGVLILGPGLWERIFFSATRITLELRRIKQQVDENRESLNRAIHIFNLLHTLSISFFELYFATLSMGRNGFKDRDAFMERAEL